jgi:hypothetical protein
MKAIWKSVTRETGKYFTEEETLSVNKSDEITEHAELTAKS